MDTLTQNSSFVTSPFPRIEFVRWQTWPFGTKPEKYITIWAEGLTEKDDFLEIVKPALTTIGYKLYWKAV